MEQDTKEVDTVTVTAPEEEIVEESEVVELPPNIEQLNARLNDLREEVAQISQVINSNQKELDTRMAAFNWYSLQLEAATTEQE
jgi:capsule polysaccharide export protein KpsE/RkpR|tara:strand:+ start:135 stop:386 length:252 start_codon:yes stop_codon:yes gene_type:complete